MARRFLLATTVLCVLLAVRNARPAALDATTSPSSLQIQIAVLPNGGSDPAAVCESRPLRLSFAIQPTGAPQQGTYRLRSIRYSVYNESEERPFFDDVVTLTSGALPGTVEVSPGIDLPADSARIRVEATLAYASSIGGGERQADAAVDVALTPALPPQYGIERAYDRMRDGFVRRHVLSAGRELGNVWLKEYEACADSKSLLPYS